MITLLGLDPATNTGWAFIEKNQLVEFGTITPSAVFSLPQKLNYYHGEVGRLVDRLKPDYLAIEDVFLGISGAKTLALLARINAVCIQSSFHYLKDRVFIYQPSFWKSNSIPNITSTSPKWKIQMEVCRYFSIGLVGDFTIFDKLEEEHIQINEIAKNKCNDLKILVDKLKSSLLRKRNPLIGDEKVELENKLKELTKQHLESKEYVKKLKKISEKKLLQIGTDIYAQTGISNDAADSACIAVCLQNQLGENKDVR